ncbi:MAG: hypothetical protein ACE5JF_12340 [Anaerolineales bacterium]
MERKRPNMHVRGREGRRVDSLRSLLADRELAMIDEALSAMALEDEIEIRLRKSPGRFQVSIRSNAANGYPGGQTGQAESEPASADR